MKIPLYQIDAFAEKIFSGNPAAVCPLDSWLPDALMQQIAMENNLAETAFFVPDGDTFQLRWFTPTIEVDLCGHATLASAHVIFNHLDYRGSEITFHSPRSGILKVRKNGDLLTLDFPTDIFKKIELTPEMISAFNHPPLEVYRGKTDYLFIFENEEQIRTMQMDAAKVGHWEVRGIITSAAGEQVDFVSRFFAPQSGILEDSVTGSAHTTLTPYWSQRLGKTELTAMQLSSRQGHLQCKYLGERVEISGKAKTFMTGTLVLD